MNVVPEDDRKELQYDLENAVESIIEWIRHLIRGVCQDNEKRRIIDNLTSESAFAIFDWGQKILPTKHREAQSEYFGKRGLSVLVASFVLRSQSIDAHRAAENVDSMPSAEHYQTSSYIVALTTANQNDLDTLSGTELIVNKFKNDFPHVTRMFKRSDNAGNFSSHSTAEAEYLICKKVREFLQLFTKFRRMSLFLS